MPSTKPGYLCFSAEQSLACGFCSHACHFMVPLQASHLCSMRGKGERWRKKVQDNWVGSLIFIKRFIVMYDTENFTNHKYISWWIFTKWTHLCNWHPPQTPEHSQHPKILPIPYKVPLTYPKDKSGWSCLILNFMELYHRCSFVSGFSCLTKCLWDWPILLQVTIGHLFSWPYYSSLWI
jgi:hypothetical protein